MSARTLPSRAGVTLLALVVLSSTSCSDSTEPERHNELLPEDRGTRLTHTTEFAQWSLAPAWTPDGRELVHNVFGTTADSLVAIGVSDGATRLLDRRTGGQYAEFVLSGDGGTVYLVVLPNLGGNAESYGIPLDGRGPAELVTDRAGGFGALAQSDGRWILPSPDHSRVAYVVAPDSLFVYSTDTGATTFLAAGCTNVVVFSPDGGQLLCRDGTDSSGNAYAIISLEDGSSQSLVLGSDLRGEFPKLVRWDASGIRVIDGGARLTLRDLATSATSLLWEPPHALTVLGQAAWSNNGRSIAFWTWECIGLLGLANCDGTVQYILYVADIDSRQASRAAVFHRDGRVQGAGAGSLAFSPDDARLAYTFGAELYVKDVP